MVQEPGAPWWRDAVVYQIYPRSFADGTGDGVGDLSGIRAHLDYLADLGVDAIWLSPIYPSPMADNGYDVSDYCDIDPVFGDLATFDALLAEAHARDIKVLLDWVPNHTSDQHPWFVASRSSRGNPKRDWYYWRDGRDADNPDTAPPNNWRAAFGGIAWTWDEPTQQWYLHNFLPQQPDLNWNHQEVVEAMHATLRFWLDRGVDGFRMDVIHMIGKDPELPDAPPAEANTNRVVFNDYPGTHALLRGIRKVLDSYPGDRTAVGEVNLRDTDRIVTYYGRDDELPLVFNFNSVRIGWDAAEWSALVDEVERYYVGDRWPVWVLSNHDIVRHRTRYGGSEARARAAAVLLLTLRGTPFLYAGEELGLCNAEVPPEQAHDPGGRDGCRAPIPWTADAAHGWTGATPWLPFPPDADRLNATTETGDDKSMLALYRALLRVRRASPALRRGELTRVDAPAGVLRYTRTHNDDSCTVIVNFNHFDVDVPLDNCTVVIDSNHTGNPVYDGRVGAETAVVLRPNVGP